MKIKQPLHVLCFSVCSLSAVAQETCPAPANTFVVEKRLPNGQIQVISNMTSIQQDNFAEFEGDVEITNKDSQIIANKAQIDRTTQQLIATGDVSYQNPQLSVTSQKVLLNTQNNRMEIADTQYELTTLNARGQAELLVVDQTQGLELNGVTFSTCPTGQEDWLVHADSITVKPDETRGVARNAFFYVQDIPIFYLPYYSFPVTDARETGLLFPQVGSSSSTGFAYEQPYYLNLDPQYDATITPRYMTKRGLQLKTEFRYLTENNSGQIDIEYLPNDSDSTTNEDRYFYRFTHKGALSDDWEVNVDFNGLSDDNYIVDLGSDYYNSADTHLFRTLGLHYYSDALNVSLQLRDFEILGDHDDTYRALPELKLDYVTDLPAGFKFDIHSELARFDNANGTSPKATRAHIAPTLSLPLENSWGEFLAETSIMHTVYRQEDIEGTDLSRDVSRTLGQAKLYGALVFERQAHWFGDNVTQTLEPRAQYLYTSYEDQSDIGLYDTTRLFNDFAGLFRGQEFTGLDRISDKNQVTLGVTSRIIDEDNREQFKLSLGQIFYLEDNKVTAASKEDDRSALAAELDWRIGSKWLAHSEVQVSTQTDKVERSSVGLEYRLARDKMLQINHRFVRDLSGEQISQLGLTASWPIAQDWYWVGRWYRDIDRHRTIESYTGLQYESCCWALRIVAQRQLTSRFDDDGLQSTDEFDSGIAIQFLFKGIGGDSSGRDMLRDGLFGYRQPYLLD
ncbi:Organic solvent tolerance protein [Paraglaciecola sp. T6c]|nr:Organic solvent tolerance protein [Paraglaciecola sp. T6c]